MSTIRKFEFKKTYKEIDINGEIYRVEFNDEALEKYKKVGSKIEESKIEVQKLEAKTNVTISEYAQQERKFFDAVNELIVAYFGEEKFEHLYELAGRSSFNLLGLIEELNSLLEEHQNEVLDRKKSKYIKPKNK
ncbi:hypothetical protein CN899_07970 [Bacillus thuringiensis]|uniref:Phage protein n=1 Tax=Bacillus thuringiensis TaxID=1428 RepID=A0A9X7C2J0_BACTU|nr:hypothetical protein [Bacillus thuringiensis]PGH85768.1 hypothetical protein CN899_07970 [Bacillus thuringiensis]